MGYTLAEKLLMRNSGASDVRPGDIVITHPDVYMMHDIYTSFLKRVANEMGVKKFKHPEKAIIFLDHLLPTNQAKTDPEHFNDGLYLMETFGITKFHKGEGISHSLMHQLKYAKPGMVATATDSHTTTYGGAGCFCTGIGHTEMIAALATDELWMKVPSAIKVVIDGDLPDGVYSKDIILKLIGDIKSDGAQYKSLEFTGSTVRSLSMEARFTIANMALEAGAKVGLFEADEKTAAYYGMDYAEIDWIRIDDDANYERIIHYQAETLVPQLSCPQGVDNVHPISKILGTKLNEVYIGSCTNGSIEDMEIVAKILEGKRIPPHMKLLVIPATNIVFKQALEKGYIQTFIKAGGMVTHPCCGLCCGQPYGLMSDGEVVLGTNNRNFIGRMGTKKSLIYLSSPAVAAASALTGVITDPRPVLTGK